MQKDIIKELINGIKTNPSHMRKFKIFIFVGMVTLLLCSALVIWVGVATFNYVATKTNEVISVPETLDKIPDLKALSCWDKAHSLMAVRPWLERPMMDNLVNLKTACFEDTLVDCKGTECKTTKNKNDNIEGRTI